ncbi:MAG: 3-deoxy-D-manno-octulosonic acid transferase [Acidobacteria bacterium]|nr:3-deoxy-D-manno-octulosonic acid transferase [Acidobacteriota bacterium]
MGVYLLYSLITLLALVALSPYFLYQALRHNKYVGSVRQRLGYLPVSLNLDADESIWVHAVSVGEVLAARSLIADLRRRYPRLRLFLSTTTLTGQQLARRSVGDVDGVFYFPFDWAFSVRRTLNRVRPRLFVMTETEIWPNLLRECRRRGVRTVLVNGRISYRSFPRYRLVRPFFRRVLDDIDRFCVQGDEAARRLVELGADPARITVTGSLKFDALDVTPPPGRGRQRVLRFFRMSPNRSVLVAGSTFRGEETAVVRAFNLLRGRVAQRPDDNPLLVIAARQPERFVEVERLCRQEGLSTIRRTELPIDAEPRADAVVLDTIGELAELYQIATVVFVGGSLVPAGGHNILEPAVFGKPIVFGPHMENFAEIADAFLANGAAVQVRSARELDEAIVGLMGDPVRRARLGAAARALVEANRGAKDKTMAAIAALVPPQDREHGAVVRPFRVVH